MKTKSKRENIFDRIAHSALSFISIYYSRIYLLIYIAISGQIMKTYTSQMLNGYFTDTPWIVHEEFMKKYLKKGDFKSNNQDKILNGDHDL